MQLASDVHVDQAYSLVYD